MSGWFSVACSVVVGRERGSSRLVPSLTLSGCTGRFQKRLSSTFLHCCHVLPISDDGGSSAEIVRLLGGPAIGDVRNRLLRLADNRTAEALAVRNVLQYRLPNDIPKAREEWGEILSGKIGAPSKLSSQPCRLTSSRHLM